MQKFEFKGPHPTARGQKVRLGYVDTNGIVYDKTNRPIGAVKLQATGPDKVEIHRITLNNGKPLAQVRSGAEGAALMTFQNKVICFLKTGRVIDRRIKFDPVVQALVADGTGHGFDPLALFSAGMTSAKKVRKLGALAAAGAALLLFKQPLCRQVGCSP